MISIISRSFIIEGKKTKGKDEWMPLCSKDKLESILEWAMSKVGRKSINGYSIIRIAMITHMKDFILIEKPKVVEILK